MKPSSVKVTTANQSDLYSLYSSTDLTAFRTFCIDLIKNARAPNHTMLFKMQKMSKDQLLFSTNNFIMKGHGMGVSK